MDNGNGQENQAVNSNLLPGELEIQQLAQMILKFTNLVVVERQKTHAAEAECERLRRELEGLKGEAQAALPGATAIPGSVG